MLQLASLVPGTEANKIKRSEQAGGVGGAGTGSGSTY